MGLGALPLAPLASKLWGRAVRVIAAGLLSRKAGPVGFWGKATQGLPSGLNLWGQESIEMKILVGGDPRPETLPPPSAPLCVLGCARSVFHCKAYFPFCAFPALLLPFHVSSKGQPISGTCFKFAERAGGEGRVALRHLQPLQRGEVCCLFHGFCGWMGIQDHTKAPRHTRHLREIAFS